MKKNMGLADKVIRVMIAVVIAILFWKGVISGVLGIVLLIFAGILVLTSLASVCPLYIPFNIFTNRVKKTE